MTTVQSPTRAILFTVLCSLSTAHCSPFLPLNSAYPPPPTLWKSFFDHFIPRNLRVFNNMHFCYVNESVTANPVFCPVFGQKGRFLVPDLPLFDDFCKPANSQLRIVERAEPKGPLAPPQGFEGGPPGQPG
jgi:hypothetical protein